METSFTMASSMTQSAFTLHALMNVALHTGDDDDGVGNADDDADDTEAMNDEDV